MDCEALRDDMMDVLYGEGDEAATRRFEAHQAGCGACRHEMAQLRRLRGDLAQWRLSPPRRGAGAAARARFPVGLAAAACLIVALGAALGLSGVEIRYDRRGFAVRLGRGGPDPDGLAEQERRHEQEIAALRAQIAAARAPGEDEVLRAVAEMIQKSESRQDAAWRASLSDLQQRTQTQRQYDLARMSAGLSYLDGKTGLQAGRTTELVGHLLQASQQK